MSNNNKIKKYTPEWENKIIGLVGGKKDEKTLQAGDIKPDGTKTTSETKINTNEVELLLGKVKYHQELIKAKKQELAKKQNYADEAKQILKEIKELDPKVKEWDKFASWFLSAYEKFMDGGTNGYGPTNQGWKALLQTYLEKKYKKVANASPSETNNSTPTEDYESNLYQFCTRTETDFNQISYWKITESEVIKLITRTVKELEEIDYNKFVAYSNSHAHPLSSDTNEIDKAEFTATKLQKYLKDIQDRSKNLVDNLIKSDSERWTKGKPANGLRVEYSFGQDHTKFGTNTPVDSGKFTETELIGLFRLMKAFQDSTWTNHADFKAATANVKDDTLIVLPAKANPKTKSEFKTFSPEDLGIPVDSSGKTKFYDTDYGTWEWDDEEITVKHNYETKQELKIEQGIQGWTQLINNLVHTGYNDFTNRQKLISSFTDDPVRQLFTDIRSYVLKDNSLKTNKETTGGTPTPDYACFGSGTDRWTYEEFPDHTIKEESRLNEYEAEKASLLEGVKTGREALIQLQKDYDEAKNEVKKLKKEVNDKIDETITTKRKELKEKYKVSDTETNDFTGDKKITLSDHYKFQRLVQNIRFLVNLDEEQATGQTNEDNAFQSSKDIFDKINTDFYGVNYGWNHMPKNDDSTEVCKTDEERIKAIKDSKSGSVLGWNLNWYHDKFVELEKIIILEDWQIQAKQKIKAAIDNQTPEQTLTDWQNSLKKYDDNLSTTFTQTKLDKWKEKKDGQAKFDNLAAIETLFKKVWVNNKIEDGFIAYLKKKDSKLTSLSQLIEHKDPVEVIKTIIYYSEYEKLSDDDKKTKKQKLVWTLGKKDKDGKYLDEADLSEADITQTLYEIAIGKTTLRSERMADETNGDNTGDESTPSEMSFAKAWFGFGSAWKSSLMYIGILLVLALIGGMIFWKSISEWWNGPAEEEGAAETEKDDDE